MKYLLFLLISIPTLAYSQVPILSVTEIKNDKNYSQILQVAYEMDSMKKIEELEYDGIIGELEDWVLFNGNLYVISYLLNRVNPGIEVGFSLRKYSIKETELIYNSGGSITFHNYFNNQKNLYFEDKHLVYTFNKTVMTKIPLSDIQKNTLQNLSICEMNVDVRTVQMRLSHDYDGMQFSIGWNIGW